MSYNPVRAKGLTNSRKRTTVDVHAGVKHSDIIRSHGVGTMAPTTEVKHDTKHGFRNVVFSGPDYTQYYECIYASNNLGVGVNHKGDRSVRVVRGSIFIQSLNSETNALENRIVTSGNYVNFPRGFTYGVATSGTTDAELIVTETADYADNWESVGVETESANVRNTLRATSRTEVSTTRRSPEERIAAKERAQEVQASVKQRGRGRPKKATKAESNANSSSIIGVNPRPSGPASFTE